jgi:AcrR family transcriptional regulator
MKQTAFAVPPQPLRAAKQQRSRILMQSVREATLELMKTLGPEEITTVKIAERAGISIGSLYRYYPNKEAILTDLYEQELNRFDQRLRARQRPGSSADPLETLMREGLELTVDFHRHLLALNATFFIEFQRNFNITDRQGPTGSDSWDRWAQQWMAEVLRNNRHRLKPSITDLEATSRLLIDMTYGTLSRIVETRPEALQDEGLVEQMAQMVLGYLLDAQPAVR